MKAASMSPRLLSVLGRPGLRRSSICRCIGGAMLTGLISISLPLVAETGAQATTSPSAVAPQAATPQTLTPPQNRTSPNTLPDAPGQPAKPASPPAAAPPKPTPAAPATEASNPPAAQASATDQEPEQAAPGDEEGTYT